MPDRDESDNPKGRLLFTDFDLSSKGRPPGVSLDLVSNPAPETTENEVLAKPLQTLDDLLSSMDLSFEADDEAVESPPVSETPEIDDKAFLDDGDSDQAIELDTVAPPAPDKPAPGRKKAPVKKQRKRAFNLDISSPKQKKRRIAGKTTIKPIPLFEETPLPQEQALAVTPEDLVAEPVEQPKQPSLDDAIPAVSDESASYLEEEVEYMPSSTDSGEEMDANALLAADEDTVYDNIAESPAEADDLPPQQTMQVRYEDLEDSFQDVTEVATVADRAEEEPGEDEVEELFDSLVKQTEGSTTTTAFVDDPPEIETAEEIFDTKQDEWVTVKSSRRFREKPEQEVADSASKESVEAFLDTMFPEQENAEQETKPEQGAASTTAETYDVDEEDIANLLHDIFDGQKDAPRVEKAADDEDFDPLLELDEEDFAKAIAEDEETAAAAVYKTTATFDHPDFSETALTDSSDQDDLLDNAGITKFLGEYEAEEGEADPLAPDSEIWDLFNPNIPTEEVLPPPDESEDVFASFDTILGDLDSHDDLLSIVPPDVAQPTAPEPVQDPSADPPTEEATGTRTTSRYEIPEKESSTQPDLSGRLPISPDSTVVMDKPYYDQLFKDMQQKKPSKKRRMSGRWQDTEDLFSNINLKKEWEERIKKYQEKTNSPRDEDEDRILADLDNMVKDSSNYPSASETDTNYDFFKNTVDFDPNNPPAVEDEEDDILSALIEEEKETADKLAAENELASLLADLENDNPSISAENESADGEAEYEIEPEAAAELNWAEESQPVAAEAEAEQAAEGSAETKPDTDTSDGTESELDLDSMVSAAGWETGQMPAVQEPVEEIQDEAAEKEQAEYKHYGPERTAPDDDEDFSSKVRHAGPRDNAEGGQELQEAVGESAEEAPAEPAEEEVAVNPLDVFANMDAFSDFDDDGLDDEMKAMLADGEEDTEGAEGGEGAAIAEAGAAIAAPLPPGFKGKVISLLRLVNKKVGRFLPIDKVKTIWQAIGIRENWRFYIDLLAALIATASSAIIVSYFLWYRN